ncbi:AAA family ATPase [Streptomyces sp. NPDC001380]|uniref:AAA family ATPase n=1 Tax=Streptomyces sp. NPDC001380 TaxID=3364566 RepID=UPI0036CE353B
MRLHSLTVTAFGPFAGTERVDFDALGASGLFLLRGATGAGKTSVLDAVCYALYGSVPGARQDGARQGARLRSDHADPERMTEVVLEVTLGGRRLEITRRPEQPRPKKRGGGFTTEKAQTLLREWSAGGPPGWRAASRSHQEVGEEVARLVGMSRDQFCQVVLLPQGDFARFLRADAAQRGELLGRLFETGRFGRVEEWLAERRRSGEERMRTAHDGLRELTARLDQAAGEGAEPASGWLPEEGGPAAVADLASRAPLWAAVLRCGAEERRAAAASALRLAEEAQREAQDGAGRVRRLAEQQRGHREAERRAAELEAEAPAREADRLRLAAARAAAPVASALRLRRTADDAHRRAEHDERQARAALGADADAPAERMEEAERQVRADLVRLEAARDDERRLAEVAAGLRRLEAEQRAVDEQRGEAGRRLAALPAEEEELDRRLAAAREGAARAEQAAALREEAGRRLDAARRRDGLRERARQAGEESDRLREEAAAARTAWLDLRERRLDGMAAELAERLRDGEPCAVCGSPEHPAPARPAGGRVTRADEQAAEAAFRRAEEAGRGAADRLRSLREEAAAAAALAGEDPVEAVAADLAAREGELAAALRSAEDLAAAGQALERLARQRAECLEQQQDADRREAACSARQDALAAEERTLAERLAAARGGAPSVAAREAALAVRAGRLAAAAAAARRTADTAARLKEADAAVAEAAVRAGFPDAAAAEDALPSPELRGAEERLERWEGARAAVRALLADGALAAAAALPPADPAAADAALERATARLRAAAAAEDAARRRCAELRRLGGLLAERAAALGPALAEQARLSRLSQLVSGTSSDNRLRMRLESYVLAARLEQVAAAASSRLVRMSGGRYTLVHSDGKAAGNRRSGLSLRVVDSWTGTERDTATLSGGESFIASLALALGLADVVTDEAGGMPLDTLFIDEGFGTLDEQALEEVLDVLDGLRERDRAVGIVSHVADLRHRVPAQLLVRKGRRGSTLELTGPDAP